MSEPRWIEALNSVRGTRIAYVIVALVSAALFFGNLGRIGIWEPWEANEIFVANEYLDRGEAQRASLSQGGTPPRDGGGIPSRDPCTDR